MLRGFVLVLSCLVTSMGTAGPDTEWREDILLPGTKINLRHPLRIHEDHNNRFVKLLSEMKKGRDGSGQAEVHDVGAPGGDSQGIVSFNECKAITRKLCQLQFKEAAHIVVWPMQTHRPENSKAGKSCRDAASCGSALIMLLQSIHLDMNPGLLRVTLSQAVHPPHLQVQWWF
ncbi:LOW QUALITY PROTEIN: hypothetical protein IFM46972_08368 [Aspergillus udagawae]|uniref:Uncharacterized protein n=1 Tax=Aspergillus udagawae TaxID=91492 RepID=A0A8H3S2P2_9EURO|nr:LOW QUALITY PROTEIN: hypothetical protein IFM46972_08368 [Aspergillus udagawae]